MGGMTARLERDVAAGAAEDRRLQWLGFGLIGLGVAIAANSLLGPLVFDAIDYPVSESMRNQTIGLDLANLLVVAPLSVLVGLLALRGSQVAPLLTLGPASYAAYMFAQYVAGPDHLVYRRVLLLQLAVFVAGWALVALAWSHLDAENARPADRRHAYVLWAMAGFVLLRYLPGIAGSLTEQPLPAEAAADPAMYWLIVLMDLGIFVPTAVVAGWAVLRRSAEAWHVLRGCVAWFTLTTIAVGVMSATMLVKDDPSASAAQLGMFAALGVATILYAIRLHRRALPKPPATDGSARSGETPRGSDRVRHRPTSPARRRGG